MSAWPALIQAACDCVFAFNNLLTPRIFLKLIFSCKAIL